MQTMSAALAPVVFQHDGTSCPGFPTFVVCCGPPQWNILFIYLFGHILSLYFWSCLFWLSEDSAHINEEQHVVHPLRNDGDVALTETLGTMKYSKTNIYFFCLLNF